MHNVPVVSAIVLHANQLSHTDLKPENILFVDSEFEVIDVIRPGKSKKVNMLSMLFIQSVAIILVVGGFLRRLAPNSVANDKINSDGENQEFRKAEFNRLSIGVDLAGILGDAWQAPKVGRWRVGCPLPSRLGDLGASWTPPAGFGTEPRPKTKWHEGHRTLLFCTWQNQGGGTSCISVPYSKFWGTCPHPTRHPRDLRPCVCRSWQLGTHELTYNTDRSWCIFMRWACLVGVQHSTTTDGHQASHAGGATHCVIVGIVANSIHVDTTHTHTHTHTHQWRIRSCWWNLF